MKPNPASESPTEAAAVTSASSAATKKPADGSVLAYLKWSSLMIVLVVIVAILATRLLRWLELA